MTAPTQQTQNSVETDRESSHEHLIRDFLNKTFNKTDLEKKCRELGLTRIWVTKNELISMILDEKQCITQLPDTPIQPPSVSPTQPPDTPVQPPSESPTQPPDTLVQQLSVSPTQPPSEPPPTQPPLTSPPTDPPVNENAATEGKENYASLVTAIDKTMEKLETKDMEIELMNEEIKAAYATIKALQQRVSELEQRETVGGSNT